MKHISITGVPARFTRSVALVSSLFLSLAPAFTAAATANVQTQELLPPGQNFCKQLQVVAVEPHVYGGLLESFDVTISDPSYVGLFAVAGNQQIPLQMISRWFDPRGERLHVDMPSLQVAQGLPITVTLLSSPPGAPTCISVVSFEVVRSSATGALSSAAGSTTASYGSAGTHSSATYPYGTGRAGGKVSAASTHKVTRISKQPLPKPVSTTTITLNQPSNASSTTNTTSTANLGVLCSGNNAYKLWFVLLIIYVILVSIVVFAEPWFLTGNVLSSTASILVPLILLLAFWYFSPVCRAASWIPVVACVIAVIGLFLAFREYEGAPEF